MILILAFTVTAVAMSVAVVAEVSNTWADVLLMSVVVLVFALLKVGLADAAFWVMLRADDATEKAMAKTAEEKAAEENATPPIRRPPPRVTRPLPPLRKSASGRILIVPGKPSEPSPARPSR
ncbi:MAG: hypothetical protein ACREQX_14645 [Candidatus Binataceae bacterium]